MTVSSRFSVASHVLALLSLYPEQSMSSEKLACSVGVNPVIVRGISSMMRRAGLVCSQQGVTGLKLARAADQISLLDIYQAVQPPERLIALHEHPSEDCTVGRHIQAALGQICAEAQAALEARLAQTSLAALAQELHHMELGNLELSDLELNQLKQSLRHVDNMGRIQDVSAD
ncbi:Rrf2 family transcriptional regulator [Deinococcus detaillensis]|uniref:Rrf2 family transcriptional regulator n=1 Tax=Deinococcus detaillensis TaxID=2592048 RepID=A0A553UR00_9DEIO|nr:Rrf2 family transcriptional regulator [Deinococcus detaillensis]TSA82585.1 Rrf2 family transcriptional regulator [Deinococcus detaillensis]